MNTLRLVFQWAAIAVLLAAGGASSSLGCVGVGGGEDCNGVGCSNTISVTAAVPPLAGTWTVTACLNGSCGSGALTEPYQSVALEPDGGTAWVSPPGSGWELHVWRGIEDHKDGDLFSLKVVDAAGNVIVEGERSLTYTTYEIPNSCGTTCTKATSTIP
jgi:hypothetical protein